MPYESTLPWASINLKPPERLGRPNTAPCHRRPSYKSSKLPSGLRCAQDTRPEIAYYAVDKEGRRHELTSRATGKTRMKVGKPPRSALAGGELPAGQLRTPAARGARQAAPLCASPGPRKSAR